MPVEPPRPKGPPLNALRAFEASARLGSFAAAANELCVTPGAVSQQINILEAWAGAPLFVRQAQGVRLTALGHDIAPNLVTAFDRLLGAANLLRRRASPNEFRIATLPSIAQLWLSARLPALRRANPGLSISVTAMERPPNLMREPFNLAIFFCSGSTGMFTRVLADDRLFPVCAPEVAKRLSTPRDLRGETLLHDASWREDWPTWLTSSRTDDVASGSGPVFSLYSLAVEEAIQGAGMLIGHAPLVATALASGALVAPFAHIVPTANPLVGMLLERPQSDTPMHRILKQLAEQPLEGKRAGMARPGSGTAPPER